MIAWRPDSATVERAQLTRFLRQTGHADFQSMYRWSIDDIPGFTAEVLRFLNVPFTRPWTEIVDLTRGPEWPKWCVGAELNIFTACIDPHPPDRDAVMWEGEEGTTRSLTYRELGDIVRRVAAGLQSLGVVPGDAVGLYLPMLPETAIAMLPHGFFRVAAAVPVLRVADCAFNAEQHVGLMRRAETEGASLLVPDAIRGEEPMPFGPRVDTRPDASAADELAAFMGRTP